MSNTSDAMKEPKLAQRVITEYGQNLQLLVFGGLHNIKGNHAPYFSLTGETWRANADGSRDAQARDCESCGCLHETILKAFPKFADLAALHLSDIDGVPMHAESNGWYNLAGALSDLQFFADHVRVPLDVALGVLQVVTRVWHETRATFESDDDSGLACEWSKASWQGARAWFHAWIEKQKPRWKMEADACIARHGLVVFGDPWQADRKQQAEEVS